MWRLGSGYGPKNVELGLEEIFDNGLDKITKDNVPNFFAG